MGLAKLVLLAIFTLSTAEGQLKLSLLHFNDFHARFEPISATGGTCKPGDNEKGLCQSSILISIPKVILHLENFIVTVSSQIMQT
jgi:2',3'-cyclic-nucleotide 2'-phosphodiesterase (5'-nucleotidase family)